MVRTRPFIPLLAVLFAAASLLAPAAARSEVRDAVCEPVEIRVDAQRIEVLCSEPVVLSARSTDRFREVLRFAYPMIAQSYQPQLGSQGKLLDYYLDMAQRALTHSFALHVWFEDDSAQSRLFGCDPRDCRAIVALAIAHPSAVAPPDDELADLDVEP